MAEAQSPAWRPRPAWHGVAIPGRHGAEAGPPGLVVEPLEGLRLASVTGRAGGGA
ncbi:sarcosine oxidase subunit gamma, partial [Rhizobiales bacterium L72]|nr:sarcosine oxidase subunit gamma [Propylenella binzhouense]